MPLQSSISAPIPVSRHSLTLDTIENYDTRRRLDATEAPLLKGQGIFYTFLYVGTPAQRVSVIVDTGSHHMAFPCAGCRCGKHMNPYFDPKKSSTAQIPTCLGNKCYFKQAYSEGSSWHAFRVVDTLWIGGTTISEMPTNKQLEMKFAFGCQDQETGLFRTQHIDGIMGLSAHEETVPFKLFSNAKTDSRSFAICLRPNKGLLSLGGVDPMVISNAPMSFVKLIKPQGWFTVNLKGVYLRDSKGQLHMLKVNLGRANKGKGVIVDSGTTDTYLPAEWKDAFAQTFRSISGIAYSNSQMLLSPNDFARLPTLVYRFEGLDENQGDVEVDVLPQSYAEPLKKSYYAFRVYLTEPIGAVLGSNFMMNHNILFDIDHSRLGIQSSLCAYTNKTIDSSEGSSETLNSTHRYIPKIKHHTQTQQRGTVGVPPSNKLWSNDTIKIMPTPTFASGMNMNMNMKNINKNTTWSAVNIGGGAVAGCSGLGAFFGSCIEDSNFPWKLAWLVFTLATIAVIFILKSLIKKQHYSSDKSITSQSLRILGSAKHRSEPKRQDR